MFNQLIKFILIGFLIMSPIIFGSIELWAFSIMELSILLIIILWAIQYILDNRQSAIGNTKSPINDPNHHNVLNVPNVVTVFLSLFLFLILFQMLPLPSGIIKIVSPKTFALRNSLTFDFSPLTFHLSFVPFATRIEFFKWLTLSCLFIFLLNWKDFNRKWMHQVIIIIMLVGIGESLYGMFEFFSGHRYILNLDMKAPTVTGTFVNHNYFAGYLLMVIPLSIGYFFSREAFQKSQFMGWRHRITSIDGKTFLIAFGIILMILALIFSASRMGIASLLLSFSLITIFFREPQKGQNFSKTTVLIFGLAILWAIWIGLDAVISRFLTSSEDFKSRWMVWVNTFQIFKDFPVFGAGLGTFVHIFPMYRSFHIRGIFTHAENDFLQLISEVGLIGIGFLLLVFAFLFSRVILAIRSSNSKNSEKYIGIGGMVGILALMFHSLVERNIQVPSNAFLYTFIWALVLKISTRQTKEIR